LEIFCVAHKPAKPNKDITRCTILEKTKNTSTKQKREEKTEIDRCSILDFGSCDRIEKELNKTKDRRKTEQIVKTTTTTATKQPKKILWRFSRQG
jgi:hypothetical protein